MSNELPPIIFMSTIFLNTVLLITDMQLILLLFLHNLTDIEALEGEHILMMNFEILKITERRKAIFYVGLLQ